jgi:hypothetical protein
MIARAGLGAATDPTVFIGGYALVACNSTFAVT